jgi:hypothetical protein
MSGERDHSIGAPNPQRHRGEDILELDLIGGGEQAEGAPFARLQRRAPQPKQIPLGGKVASAGGLAATDLLNDLVCGFLRNQCRHRDQILHLLVPPELSCGADGVGLDSILLFRFALRAREHPG